ncbi:MAG: nicotinamide mononucleotide transporter [Nanoarchaeota archaeon]|nr:nicotinamide mononucleotide transporter [Nanoarchaeota archaeon]
MIEFIVNQLLEGFSRYYGLDYISFILGVSGTILLTKKNEAGFLLTASSVVLASIVAVIAQQYGFLVANTVSFVLLIRGFIIWRKEKKLVIKTI